MAVAEPHQPPGVVISIRGGGPRSSAPTAAKELLLEIAHRAVLELVHATDLELEHGGDRHFERLLAAIAGAGREISIEMYQIRPDPVGWALCTALAQAAMRGVSVRLLLDRFGSSRVAGWLAALESQGIDVRWYRPWRPWHHPLKRTHRKLVLVDGRIGSIGGINLAAEFSEHHQGPDCWRDLALWMTGPVVWLLRQQFEAAWRREGGAAGPPVSVPSPPGSLCAVAGGHTSIKNHGDGYVAMAEAAQHELLLATPYFLPDRTLRSALAAAARRGVRVVVVVPRRSDLWWFKHGSRRRYLPLLSAGVSIWERCDRMLHAKVGVVDGQVAAVGSANLNRLSFRGNSETLLMTSDPGVVAGVHSMIADESAVVAEALDASRWRRHPDRRRLAELVASPMALIF
jgi:cardiolipin synthase